MCSGWCDQCDHDMFWGGFQKTVLSCVLGGVTNVTKIFSGEDFKRLSYNV
jgi:hypothetical protein